MASQTRYLIADDHSIIRNALKYTLMDINPEADFTEARSYGELLNILAADSEGFGLVVMDLRMPGFEGISQIERVVKAAESTPVAVFSMLENENDMREILALGVAAYIPKSIEDVQIGNILRLVISGGSYVPPVLSGVVTGGLAEMDDSMADSLPGRGLEDHPIWNKLTRRQREVLLLLGEGLSNNEIANRLNLTISTVKTHVTGILRALGVDNRTQAVLVLREYLGRR